MPTLVPPHAAAPLPSPPSSATQLLLTHAGRPDADRRRCEAFVAEVYARSYGARVTHYLPLLLGLGTAGGGLSGVIGACPASSGPALFLETYLDLPVESALAAATGQPVRREDLAEVGNLSSAGRGGGTALITALAAWLDGAEIPWAVFTATDFLRALFRRLGVPLVDLASAPGERLGERLRDWGTYYETAPRVVAARVADVRRAGWRHPRLDADLEALWSRAFVHGCAQAVRAGAA